MALSFAASISAGVKHVLLPMLCNTVCHRGQPSPFLGNGSEEYTNCVAEVSGIGGLL